jgi:DivIVA domain-containing protein
MACVNFAEEAEAMASYIRNAAFRTTRLAAGYNEQEVDAFLEELAERVRRGEPVSRPPKFSETRLRPGYVKSDVDALIAEVARLARRLRADRVQVVIGAADKH